jgi:hypothetical protein
LNVRRVKGIKYTEIHTPEQLMPEPTALEFELAIEKLHRSPVTDKIPAQLTKAGSRTIHCKIHKLITSLLNNEELRE